MTPSKKIALPKELYMVDIIYPSISQFPASLILSLISTIINNPPILPNMKQSQRKPSGFIAPLDSTPKTPSQDMIKIAGRFFLTTTKYSQQSYNAYNGIDIKEGRWVVVYLRLVLRSLPRATSSSHSPGRSRRNSATPSAQRSFGRDQWRSIRRDITRKCMRHWVLA